MSGTPWTEEELARLMDMIHAGVSFAQASKALGRGPQAAKKKWYHAHLEKVGYPDTVRPVVVDSAAWERRNEYINAAPRDLTAALMGDPPNGFSALEGRR